MQLKSSVLSAAVKSALVAAGLAAGVASAMTPGAYEATAQGRNADITVRVTVSADKIEKIEIVKHSETPGIGDLAVNELPAAMLSAQTAAVDAVGGATMSSAAIKKAVAEALRKAGASDKFLTAPKAGADKAAAADFKTSADVIVVGAGGAGMVAAATAVDNGATVIVLEKMAMLGGNTARSEGNMSAMDPEPEKLLPMTQAVRDIIAKYTNPKVACSPEAAELQKTVLKQLAEHDAAGKKYIFDSPELFALQTIVGGNCKNDAKLVLTMTRNATAAMKWLDAQSEMTWFHVPRSWVDVGIGGLYPRGQWPRQADGKTPISTYDAYIRPLAAKVEVAGNPIYKNMKVVSVERDASGRVTGVKAVDRKGVERVFSGRSVVLAAGGYGANLQMVKKYNDISVTVTSNSPGTTGEVLEEAVAAGAGLTGMEWIQIHPHGNPKNGELESAIAARPSDTPYVNRDGLRFVDETGRRDEISYGILKQPGQVAFSIYDQRTIEEKKVEEKKIESAIAHGYAFKADTLEDLARQAGIDWKNFEKTMKAYNEASVSQNTKSLPVPKILIGNPVVKAPFYAVPITTTIHHTMGGLRINEKTQVLDKNGNVIPGLYAAGEITGGIHGGNRLGRNALTDLLVFGHIAGQEVAKVK